MKPKLLYIGILAILVAGAFYAGWYAFKPEVTSEKIDGFERVAIPSRIASEREPDIEFLSQEGLKLLTDVYSVPLPNGKMFYLGMPVALPINERGYLSRSCGSGGCDYYAYFGDIYVPGKPTPMKQIAGFDSYLLDCDTGKAIFYPDEGKNVFGFPRVDKVDRVVRVYEHLTASLGFENVYLIADDGTPKLIASYSNWCDDSMQSATSTNTLYRDRSYPSNLTAF